MVELVIHPGFLKGTITPPPSKSDAHRALIAAALAGSSDRLTGLPDPRSEDIQTTERCLDLLLRQTDNQNHADQPLAVNCAESGTTLRFLIPLAAALGLSVTFTGIGRLPSRPLTEYRDILGQKGIDLIFPENSKFNLPLRISGQLRPGLFSVPGHISSQYISGLLMALPLLAGDSQIKLLTPLASAPYVDMTIAALARYGVSIRRLPDGFQVPGGQKYTPCDYQIETDYSQAAFWLTAAYCGSDLKVVGLNDNSLQGDKMITGLLADFASGSPVYTIDVQQVPDLVPIVSVAAALTTAETRIIRAERLRLKESDRLLAVSSALQAIGADIEQTADGLLIRGGKLNRCHARLPGGKASGFADHRIVMALTIAALSTEKGVQLTDAESVNKSYPDFFRDFRILGGNIDGINMGESTQDQLIW